MPWRPVAKEKSKMQSVEEFLAYSVHLELDAVLRFDQLADAMDACGNLEVAKLFRRLASFSRLHLADVRARLAHREVPAMKPADFVWPGLGSPETAAMRAADSSIGCEQALEIALETETRAFNYYKSILDTATGPEIKMFAKEFAEEESEHVAELKKWIAAQKAGRPLPVDR